ncbi:hypothetical protein QNI19_21585 [Cytophagaceae bacterium DM2B3-1]|uniref:Uncharacterized protein n=2 Tax=Xanthocytophaga flava TaxID=3048013 RepID=A0ABT7CRF5_9BACT|nr:hypothetical protein [Xanthocytophaga flavus]MDJ1466342.1 hypothetical protein [Xanthocytophaga flavus]MDJ1495545.1 hypothetical protein [Xanthocytophaga flavus]
MLREHEADSLCDTCKFPYWFKQLPTELQTQIDSMIFANDNKLFAIKLMKDYLKIRLYDSNDLLRWRFELLKESSIDKFTCDPDTFWDGFYTL